MNLTLVVLAAGMGSRYGGLKQVDPVGPHGEILLEYSVYDALQAGFDRLVCVIRRDIQEAFDQHIASRLQSKIQLDYAFQELDDLPPGHQLPPGRSKPWGTGHAIWACRDIVDEPFLAINADDFYGPESYRLLAHHLNTSSHSSMAGFRLRNTLSEHGSVSRGVCELNSENKLQSVQEHTKIVIQDGQVMSLGQPGGPQALNGEEVVSMNFWGLQPTIFPELTQQLSDFLKNNPGEKGELYIPTVLDKVIREGRGEVQVLASPESWFGVTYPQDKPLVVEQIRKKIAQGFYPERLWS